LSSDTVLNFIFPYHVLFYINWTLEQMDFNIPFNASVSALGKLTSKEKEEREV